MDLVTIARLRPIWSVFLISTRKTHTRDAATLQRFPNDRNRSRKEPANFSLTFPPHRNISTFKLRSKKASAHKKVWYAYARDKWHVQKLQGREKAEDDFR